MSQIKLKHSSGNGSIIAAPASNPSSDITLKLPSTTGSAGQVLSVASSNHSSTNAELEFAAAGDYVKISSDSGTSGGAALVFDNLDITTYKAFDFICTFIPNSDNRNCSFVFRSGGASGSDISGANYTYGADGQYPTHNEQIIARSGETHFEIAENVGADTEEGIHMEARIHFATSSDPGDLARLTNRIYWNANYRVHTPAFRNIVGVGVYDLNDTTYPTGFKVSFIGANIDAYTYCLYGIKR